MGSDVGGSKLRGVYMCREACRARRLRMGAGKMQEVTLVMTVLKLGGTPDPQGVSVQHSARDTPPADLQTNLRTEYLYCTPGALLHVLYSRVASSIDCATIDHRRGTWS